MGHHMSHDEIGRKAAWWRGDERAQRNVWCPFIFSSPGKNLSSNLLVKSSHILARLSLARQPSRQRRQNNVNQHNPPTTLNPNTRTQYPLPYPAYRLAWLLQPSQHKIATSRNGNSHCFYHSNLQQKGTSSVWIGDWIRFCNPSNHVEQGSPHRLMQLIPVSH